MPGDALIELACDAADGCLVADIRRTEAAGGHAADKRPWFQQDHAFAHATGLDGRADAARGRSKHADVRLNELIRRSSNCHEDKQQYDFAQDWVHAVQRMRRKRRTGKPENDPTPARSLKAGPAGLGGATTSAGWQPRDC